MTRALRAVPSSLIGICFAVSAACVVPVISGHVSKRVVIFAAAGFAGLLLAMKTREVKSLLLFAFIAALSYYRTYFLKMFGDYGGYGPYWVHAELPLLAMLAWWAYEASVLKRKAVAKGAALWVFWTPFVLVSMLSALSAGDFGLAMTDILRVILFGVVLRYVQYHVGRTEWWWCIVAVAVVVVAQSLFGVVQVTTGRFAPGGQDAGEFRRATGTMVHPNILGPYLIAVVPLFLSLAATASTPLLRLGSLITAGIGSVGIACTMSRAPWVLLGAEFVVVLAGLCVFRLIGVQQAIGILALATVLIALVALPFANKIAERMVSNVGESVKFRTQLNGVALAMYGDHPLLGIGPNHFTGELPKYDASFSQSVENVEQGEEVFARAIAAVHNFYLLILAETGAAGFASLLVFLAAVLYTGARAVARTEGAARGACFGILVGIIALLLEEFTDFSLWMDPGFFTFALLAGLLNNAIAVNAAGSASSERQLERLAYA